MHSSAARRSPQSACFLAVTVISCLVLWCGLGWADDPEGYFVPRMDERGQSAGNVYLTDGELESIDPGSGNLMLNIPLGQVYQVGPRISYQFRAVHSSNLWDQIRIACPTPPRCDDQSFAVPNRSSNAGIGWEVHFGKLFPFIPPEGLSESEKQLWPRALPVGIADPQSPPWLYVAPDGAQHAFFYRGAYPQPGGSSKLYYSRDGSFARLKQTSASEVQIETPDRVKTFFERVDDTEIGNLFCRPGVSGCWRIRRIEDPFGNFVELSYDKVGGIETWEISDSVGRTHYIRFETSNQATGGGDGHPAWSTGDGDEWGDLRRIVREVDVAAFDGGRAVYRFEYLGDGGPATTVSRACPHDFTDGSHTLTTRVLSKVHVPDSQPYVLTTYATPFPAGCDDRTGKVTRIGLPSQGAFAYEYGPWEFPTRCVYTFDLSPSMAESYFQLGVKSKSTVGHTGAVLATWRYEPKLIADPPLHLPGGLPGELYGLDCRRADYIRTVVREPATGPQANLREIRRVFYTSVTEGRGQTFSPSTPRSAGWRTTDNGLPYNLDLTTGPASDPLFLSEEVWEECPAACAPGTEETCGCDRKRSIFRRYAMEVIGGSKVLGRPLHLFRANTQLEAIRTVYHDDGERWKEVTSSSNDGAGHWRETSVRDDFTGTVRTVPTTTEWDRTGRVIAINPVTGYFEVQNPSSYLPGPDDDWLLETYSETRRQDGGRTYVTETEFNDGGLPFCTRRWVGDERRSEHDLVRLLEFDGNGLPVKETLAGGDTTDLASLPTAGGPCDLPPMAPAQLPVEARAGRRFVIDHEYEHLQLERSEIEGFPHSYRAEIDRNTGLPRVIYSVTDVPTTYHYDRLGRLTRILPDSRLREAETQIRYQNPAGSLPTVVTERLYAGQSLDRRWRRLEEFGRPVQERLRRPSPGNPEVALESRRDYFYDKAGNLLAETTWQDAGQFDPDLAMTYRDYDAFGRPAAMARPDGEQTSYTYSGDRLRSSEWRVRTGQGFETVGVTEEFDGQGRTVLVDGPLYSERTTWDPAGQVLSRTRFEGASSQTRSYGYDGRGFMVSETHPELGPHDAPAGSVVYERDALGKVRTRFNGLNALEYLYDAGGRPTEVREAGGQYSWQQWRYGEANAGSNLAQGRLVEAVRHNHVPGEGIWSVVETYRYAGALGLLDQKLTQMQFPESTGNARYGVAFEQSRDYDALGRVSVSRLPVCIDVPQTGEKFCNDPDDGPIPPHTVTTTWQHGSAVRVESNFNIAADLTYHPNRQLAWRSYATGQGVISESLFDQGTNGMNRAARIRHRKFGGALFFDSGEYGYDGAGNVWRIGDDVYAYDETGRLTSGTVTKGGVGRRAEYTYDLFDNILTTAHDGGRPVAYQIDAKNRVRGDQTCPDSSVYDTAGNLRQLNASCTGASLASWEYDSLSMPRSFFARSAVLAPLAHQEFIYGPGNFRFLVFDRLTGTRTYRLRELHGDVVRELSSYGWGPGVGGEEFFLEQDFVRGPGGLIATRGPTGNKRFYHLDHLGSTRVISNPAGNVTGRLNYYPFGLDAPPLGPELEPVATFAGHEREDTGFFYYMKARIHNSVHGRFNSVDPARDGWNLYTYARNNPVTLFDPTGLAPAGRGYAHYLRYVLARDAREAAALVLREGGSQAIGYVPFVDYLHDGAQVFLGRDYVTGEKLTPAERVMTGGAFIVPYVGGATVRKFGQAIVNRQRDHFSVDLTPSGGFESHLLLNENGSRTFAVSADFDSPGKTLASHTVDLPNPDAAVKLQEDLLLGGDLGPFDIGTNSCASHVCDILKAGGLDVPPAESESYGQYFYLIKLTKGRE